MKKILSGFSPIDKNPTSSDFCLNFKTQIIVAISAINANNGSNAEILPRIE